VDLCLGLVLHGLCPGYQLLQFAVNIRVSDVLILKHSVGIDGESGGNRVDAKGSRDFAIEASN
jgi:hypothetical protein